MSDWTKVEKEKGTDTKVDRVDCGWFVNGWFEYGWFIDSLWEGIDKLINGWNKVIKE